MKPHIIHVSLPGLLPQGKSFAPLPGKTTSKNSFSVKPFFWWYLYFLVRINKMVSSLDYHPSPTRLAQGCILSYFYELLRALSLSSECLLNFLSSVYILPCVGKIFNFMEFSFLENAIIRGIFTHAPPHLKLTPKFLSSRPRQKEITHSPGSILSKICFPQQQK